jgi:hypothetical protein
MAYYVEKLDPQRRPGYAAAIRNENGSTVAFVPIEADAHDLVAAHNFIEDVTSVFPGLVDGESEVNGGDVVDFFGYLRWDSDGYLHYQEESDGGGE